MKHFAHLPSLAGMLVLAACAATPPLATNCPNVAVLAQGGTLTEFLPGRQDVAAQITKAQITGVAGSCALEKKKNQLVVKFQAGFAATNGPANRAPGLILPYLVSVSRGDDIIAVTNNTIPLNFGGNASVATATSRPITFTLPNTPGSATLDILVSFHLTPGQLAYNTAHPGQ